MKQKLPLILVVVLCHILSSRAQVGINNNGSVPDPSAMLEIASSDKGLLIPRMTQSEKEGIADPANGLVVYQTDGIKGFHYYNGANWVSIQSLPSSAIVYSETERNKALTDAGYQLWGRESKTIETASFLNDAGRWSRLSRTNWPDYRRFFDPVSTGDKLIIWGGLVSSGRGTVSNEGALYDIATDTWTSMSTINAPSPRRGFNSVWTGDKMIVWGGRPGGSGAFLTDGGIYDPATDTWTSMSTTNAPLGATYRTAVWTGSQLIVWGGLTRSSNSNNRGGVYDLATDTWTATSIVNVPEARYYHTAVWTGTEMIVWGGANGLELDSGAKYNPATDTWTSIATDPNISPRSSHAAIFLNGKMIVTGGTSEIDGAQFAGIDCYDPVSDGWTTLSAGGFNRGEVKSIVEVDNTIYMSYGAFDRRKYFFNLDTNSGGVLPNNSNLDTHQEILTDGINLFVYGQDEAAQYKLQPSIVYQTMTKFLYLFQKL